MKRTNNHRNIYKFLEPFLEAGCDAQKIEQLKKQYYAEYKRNWRKENRKKLKGFTPYFSFEEVAIITEAALKHKRSKTKFIRHATLAYANKNYLVPDIIQIRKINQLLEASYNKILEMRDENQIPAQTGKVLLEKYFELERQVRVQLNNPKTIEERVIESIKNNPKLKSELLTLLQTS